MSQFHWFLVIVPRPCHLSELTTNKAWLDLGLTRISISMILLSLKFPILGMCVVYWYIIICRILIIQNLQNTCGKLWNVFVDKRRQNYYYSWAGTILCRYVHRVGWWTGDKCAWHRRENLQITDLQLVHVVRVPTVISTMRVLITTNPPSFSSFRSV